MARTAGRAGRAGLASQIGRAGRTLGILAITVWLVGGSAAAQTGSVDDPETIRAALEKSGFGDAASSAGVPDLNRPLTSSRAIIVGDGFIAAYYFDDEGSYGQLGPLHVSRFDRASRTWMHAADLGGDAGGTVARVDVQGRYVLVTLLANPSAGGGLVLNAATLEKLRVLPGLYPQLMSNGQIRFSGNVEHLAPRHQHTLRVFDPVRRVDVEVFPGKTLSPAAAAYRASIVAAHNALPADVKREYESRSGRVVDDFNRTIGEVVESADGRRLTFVVTYTFDQFPDSAKHATLTTVASCDLEPSSGTWSCTERADEARR